MEEKKVKAMYHIRAAEDRVVEKQKELKVNRDAFDKLLD